MPHDISPSTASQHALEALAQDALLPICTACGTQYPAPRQDCPICLDPRQAVPHTGQTWTSLSQLREAGHRNTLHKDEDDERVVFIGTSPSFAIGQNPILIKTPEGSFVWDCAAYLSPDLVGYLQALDPALQGISISHPHFFATSLTWARALRLPLYLNEADKEWYQRLDDIRDTDQVVWWRHERALSPAVKMIECGGHFPGSSVLYWDRSLSPSPLTSHSSPPSTRPSTPPSSTPLLLVSDTLMVQPHLRGFTFIFSVPNLVPLSPLSTLTISHRLQNIAFGQATSAWPGRFIRKSADRVMRESVGRHLGVMGWKERDGGLVDAREA